MKCIIHHWDTDGICSAAIIAGILEEKGEMWENISPEIGEFKLPRNRLTRYHASDIHVVDLNLPEEIEMLAPSFKRIFFIDHHPQKKINLSNVVHVNPNLNGNHSKDLPSATWVVSDYFNRWNHLSALGAIGDLGLKAFNYERNLELLAGLTQNQALRLVKLIDSNYIVMDRGGVEEAVTLVLKNSPQELLEIKKWNRNLERISEEVERIITKLKSDSPYCELHFESDMNVISIIARKIIWEMGHNVVLAVNHDFNGKSQIYLRINPNLKKLDIIRIITKLKDNGFNAGGKKDVLGVICNKNDVESVLAVVEPLLRVVK